MTMLQVLCIKYFVVHRLKFLSPISLKNLKMVSFQKKFPSQKKCAKSHEHYPPKTNMLKIVIWHIFWRWNVLRLSPLYIFSLTLSFSSLLYHILMCDLQSVWLTVHRLTLLWNNFNGWDTGKSGSVWICCTYVAIQLEKISKKYCKVVSRQPRLHFRFYGMPYVWLETLKLMNFNVTCIHMLKILLVFPPIKILMKRKYEASLCANFHLDKNQHLPFFFIFLSASF